MARWIIYNADGTEKQVTWSNNDTESAKRYVNPTLEYNGTWMGECYVSLTVQCATPINFEIGDYILYRGEKFVINNAPTVNKKARRNTNGEGFTYDSIKFNSLLYELSDVRMLDYVLYDNGLHYTGLPEFSFFCNNIDDLADRLQVNAARYCEENGFDDADYWVFLTPDLTRSLQRCTSSALKNVAQAKYEEVYGPDGSQTYLDDEKVNQNVQISKQSVWDACKFIKDTFGLNFIVRGRFVIIGAAGLPTQDIFRYGKGNGLYEIERTVDQEQQVVTKLYAYGTGTNLPIRYYANLNTRPYLKVIDDYHHTSIDNSLSVALEGLSYNGGAFTNLLYDDGSLRWYSCSCMVGTIECGANIETTYTAGGTVRLLLYPEGYNPGVGFDVNHTTQANIDAVKALLDNGEENVVFLSAIDVDKFPADRRWSSTSNLPNNMAVNVLMLPGFPNQSLYDWVLAHGGTAVESPGNNDNFGLATWQKDAQSEEHTAFFSKDKYQPYIVSQNYLELGIREATKHWDGSDDTDDIHPSIEDTGFDIITGAETIDDNGVYAEGETVQGFDITLPDFGSDFMLDELMRQSDGSATISMKDGYCGGREFEIASAKQNGDGTWLCKCQRTHDDVLDLWFPYSYHKSIGQESQADEPYQVRQGDKYVLLNIPMTSTYVNINAIRLLDAALTFLEKNDYTRFSYTPKVDEIFMAYQHDRSLEDNSIRSYHDTIKEGDIMLFGDDDLGIDGSVFIDKLIIKEYGNAQIPTYDVTLRNDKQVGTIQRIQNQINSLSSTVGGGGSGVNIPGVKNLIAAYGKEYFLSKKTNDSAAGKITFQQGWNGGAFTPDLTGAGLWKDGDNNWHIESDYLHARKELVAKEVQIEDVHHVGGQQLLTAASMHADYVVNMDGAWRCFFLKEDDNQRQVTNNWKVGDQAYVNTFNLERQEDGTIGNHYLWRLVTGTSNETPDTNTYTVDGETFDASKYHYIDLSKDICDEQSDAPKQGDDIVQLGHQGNYRDRQNAIIIAGAGESSPYIREITGIVTFHLPDAETQLKPGDNKLTGKVQMVSGSTFPDGSNVEQFVNNTNSNIDGLQNTIETLDTGNENLLLNTGFTGDFTDESVRSDDDVSDDTQMYSRQLKHWEYQNVEVVPTADSASGYGVRLSSGSLSQVLTKPMTNGTWYCISFKASGSSVIVSFGGYQQVVTLTDSVKRYIIKMACEDANANTFTLSGATGLFMEIMVTEGRIPNTDWLPSPQDNDKSLAYYQNLSYLMSAITNASTTILGGLILSQMLRVGNYRDGVMTEETGGMSGLYMNGNSPFLWGGGDMDKAFYTINKYAQNPAYQPTDEEVAQMAKFVVTHGGRAILNDIILRGYIYALGGRFKGEVVAESGVFKNVHSQDNKFAIDDDGNFSCKDAKIGGNMYNPLFEITNENASDYLIYDQATGDYAVRLDLAGLNLQIGGTPSGLSDTTVTLPTTSEYNGAKVHIRNAMQNYKVLVGTGGSRYAVVELNYGDIGVFLCYHASGNNYYWTKIN